MPLPYDVPPGFEDAEVVSAGASSKLPYDVPPGFEDAEIVKQEPRGGVFSEFASGIGAGAKRAYNEFGSTKDVFMRNGAEPIEHDTDPAANTSPWEAIKHPIDKLPRYLGYGLGHSTAEMLGSAGAAIGIGAAGGGLAGAAAGAALAPAALTFMREYGPVYQEELKANGGDKDAAANAALKKAGISAAGSAVSFGAFSLPVGFAKQLLIQPAIAIGEQVAQNRAAGKPLTDSLVEAALGGGVGMAVPAAAHLATKPFTKGKPAASNNPPGDSAPPEPAPAPASSTAVTGTGNPPPAPAGTPPVQAAPAAGAARPVVESVPVHGPDAAQATALGGAEAPTVVRGGVIPGLAEHGPDGTLKIDQRVPEEMSVAGQTFDPADFLGAREEARRAAIGEGATPEDAHTRALAAEKAAVEAAGIDHPGYLQEIAKLQEPEGKPEAIPTGQETPPLTVQKPKKGRKKKEAAPVEAPVEVKPEPEKPLPAAAEAAPAEPVAEKPLPTRAPDGSKFYKDLTPEERAKADEQRFEENYAALLKKEPNLTRDELRARMASGMSMVGSMLSDEKSSTMSEAAAKAAVVTPEVTKSKPISDEARAAAEKAAADVTAKVAKEKPAVLPDLSAEGAANVVNLEKVAKTNIKAEEAKAKDKERSHKGEAHIKEMARQAAAAKTVVEQHIPKDAKYPATPEARDALRDRLGKMLEAAKAEGVQLKKVYETTPDHIAYLKDAADLHAKLKLKSFVGGDANQRILGFLTTEKDAANGDFGPLRSRRKFEGEQAKRVAKGDQEAFSNEEVAPKDERLKVSETPETALGEKQEQSGAEVTYGSEKEAYAAGNERPLPESAPPALGPKGEKIKALAERGATEGERAAAEAALDRSTEPPAGVIAGKDQTGKFKVEVRKNRSIKKKEPPKEAPPAELTVKTVEQDEGGPTLSGQIAHQAAKVDTNPTEAQKKAGNYEKGHVNIGGLDITIENPRGSIRRGVDEHGQPWEVKMPAHYGYIKKTTGADYDHVDVYLGERAHLAPDRPVFVISQVDAKTGKFDEHKVFLGYKEEWYAAQHYVDSFSDGKGHERIGRIWKMSFEDFKNSLDKVDEWPRDDRSSWTAEDERAYAQRNSKEWLEKNSAKTVAFPDLMKLTLGALEKEAPNWVRGLARAMMPRFAARITELIKDVPVHILEDDKFRVISNVYEGQYPLAYYDSTAHRIVIPKSTLLKPYAAHTVLHEGLHAAFMNAIWSQPHIRRAVERVMFEAQEAWNFQNMDKRKAGLPEEPRWYGFTNVDEFIAEAFSNPKFQAFLHDVGASTDLAAILRSNEAKAIGRETRSLWTKLKDIIASTLHIPQAEHTLFDAVLHIGAELEDSAKFYRPRGLNTAQYSIRGKELGLNKRANQMALRVDPMEHARDVRGALKSWLDKAGVGAHTAHWLRMNTEGTVIGPAMDKLVMSMSKVAPFVRKAEEKNKALAAEVIDYVKANPVEGAKFADLANDARLHDTNLVVGTLQDMIAANQHHGKDATSGWQAKAAYGDLQQRFMALSPEARDLWNRAAAYYKAEHNTVVADTVKSLLDSSLPRTQLTPLQVAQITRRTLAGKLNSADQTLLGKSLFAHLRDVNEFRTVSGTYFPLFRYGDHVVVGKHKIADTMGGREVEPGVVRFSDASDKVARDKARALAEDDDLITKRVEKIWVDPATGARITADEAKNLPGAHIGYDVHKQIEGVHMFESRRKAERFYRSNPEGYQTIEPPQRRYGEGYHAATLTGTQMSSLVHAIDSRTDLTPGMKTLLRNAMLQASARLAPGNRFTKRRLKAQKVSGASTDFARNLLQYGSAAAQQRAVAAYAPVVRKAFSEMHDTLASYTGPDKARLVDVRNEMEKRINQGATDPQAMPRIVKDMMAVSYMTRLASGAYSVVNATQTAMVTLPWVGGKFGYLRTEQELGRAYRDMGALGVAGKGILNTAKAARFIAKDVLNTEDLVPGVKARLARTADGVELNRMVDYLVEHDAINPDAGFDISHAVSEGRGVVGQAIAKTDRMFRQLPQAVEVVNRVTTAVTAYRLGRARGMTEAQATKLAFDSTIITQGDYGHANAPRWMRSTKLAWATQFKRYALMMGEIGVDMAKRAFGSGVPREARAIALKQLAGFVAVQVAVAGTLSVPGMELIRVGAMIAGALGIGSGWQPIEDALHRLHKEAFGKTWGELLASGVLTRAIGIDVSSRISWADLFVFGEPKSSGKDDTMAFLASQLLGSPGTMAMDWYDALHDMEKGDWGKALGKMAPMKTLGDFTKAITRYSQGKQTGPEIALNTFGFRSGRQAERGREIGANIRENKDMQDRYKELSKRFMEGTPSERAKMMPEIRRHNKDATFRWKIHPNSLRKLSKQRRKEDAESLRGD